MSQKLIQIIKICKNLRTKNKKFFENKPKKYFDTDPPFKALKIFGP